MCCFLYYLFWVGHFLLVILAGFFSIDSFGRGIFLSLVLGVLVFLLLLLVLASFHLHYQLLVGCFFPLLVFGVIFLLFFSVSFFCTIIFGRAVFSTITISFGLVVTSTISFGWAVISTISFE